MRKIIRTGDAPAAIGTYSQGVVVNGFVYTSGQIAIHPHTGELVAEDFEKEVRQVLDNLSAVLKAGGSSLNAAVKLTVFLKDMSKFARLNEVFKEYFPHDPPARSAVGVCSLPKDVNVEIEAVGLVIE